MNARFLFLAVSLVANIALGMLVFARRSPAHAVPADHAGPVRSTAATTGSAAPTVTATTPAAAATSPADLEYVARLRAIGLPADLIRELVYARVQARYRERLRALLPQVQGQYWRGWNYGPWTEASPEALAKARELNKEMDAEIRALLGEGPDALGPYERRLYDQMASYLPAAKIQQLEAIRKDYDDLAARVREQGKGLVLKSDREQLRLLERERRKDLEAALTPDELLEYDLRASPTALGLRYRLASFEPDEQEFRTLAQLQLELDRQFGTDNLSGEEQDRRRAAEKDLLVRLQSVLPPDRYADYLVSIDGMFSQTRYFTNSYDLAPSVAKEIVALKQSTWKRVDELDQAGVTGDQRTAALIALQQEVDSQLTARLGAGIFASYKKSGATWMNRLRPRPRRRGPDPMNPRLILLAVSLLANAGLLAAYLVSPSGPATSAAAQRDTRPASATAPSAPAAVPQADAAATTAAKGGFSWAAIETTDLDELARRLKAAGFTTKEVRLILGRRIATMTATAPGIDAAKSTPYWRAPWGSSSDPKAAEEIRKRNVEQARLYRKYMNGPDGLTDDPERIEGAKRIWGDLPVEKLQAIATIEADYEELRTKQFAERRYRPGEEAGAFDTWRLMERERQADIAKVLTPEEFAAFELRASPIASEMRFQLETFKASEDEYKAIFAINKAYADRLLDPQLSADARKALAAEITAKVKEVLGADRALDYDAAANQNSQDLTAGIVSRLGLPARVAAEVRQTQTDFTQRAKDIRANTGLGPDERSAQLEALAAQAQAQLTAKLGADGFEAYNDRKGEWLRNLKPKTGPGGP